MTDTLSFQWLNFLRLANPLLSLLSGAFFILLLGSLKNVMKTWFSWALAVFALVLALLQAWQGWLDDVTLSTGMFTFDRFTYLAWVLIFAAGLFTVLMARQYLQSRLSNFPEFYVLILFALVGCATLIAASDFITLFLGLETMSIAIYVLAGFFRNRPQANEGALKYFLMGAFASAFLLMGIVLLFGATGSTELMTVARNLPTALAGHNSFFAIAGIALVLIGFAFKISAVPFHAWAPDVYDAASTPITHFMATAVKVAAIAALLRCAGVMLQLGEVWIKLVWLLALGSMVLGNLSALVQDNLKRMLAYSSIAHVGYMLLAFMVLGQQQMPAMSALLFYLVGYVMTSAGAFAVLVACQGKQEYLDISHLAGLGERRPLLAAALTVCFLSLAGFPPTVGFFAKYYLFQAVIKAGYVWLVVVALLASAVSVYYYLRPVVVMYFGQARDDQPLIDPAPAAIVAVVLIALLFVLFFGLFPSNLLGLVQASLPMGL